MTTILQYKVVEDIFAANIKFREYYVTRHNELGGAG